MARDRGQLIKAIADVIIGAVEFQPSAAYAWVTTNGFPMFYLGFVEDEGVEVNVKPLTQRAIDGSSIQLGYDIEANARMIELSDKLLTDLERFTKERVTSWFLVGPEESIELGNVSTEIIIEAVLAAKGKRTVTVRATRYIAKLFEGAVPEPFAVGVSPSNMNQSARYFRELMKYSNVREWYDSLVFWAAPILSNFDQPTKLFDLSWKRKVMTLFNSPSWNAIPGGLTFDGVDDYGVITGDGDFNMNYSEKFTNGDFETQSDFVSVGNHNAVRDNADAQSGSFSLFITASGAGAAATNCAKFNFASPLQTSKQYTLEFWARSASGNTSLTISGASGSFTVTKTITGAWAKYVLNFIPSATCSELYAFLGGGGTCFIDNISITESANFTLLVWARIPNTGADIEEIVSSGYNYRLYIAGNGTLVASMFDGVTTLNSQLAGQRLNVWKFYAYTVSRLNSQTLYADGVQVDQDSVSSVGKLSTSASRLDIARLSSPLYYSDVTIGELQLVKGVALSAAQIQKYYQATRGIYGV